MQLQIDNKSWTIKDIDFEFNNGVETISFYLTIPYDDEVYQDYQLFKKAEKITISENTLAKKGFPSVYNHVKLVNFYELSTYNFESSRFFLMFIVNNSHDDMED